MHPSNALNLPAVVLCSASALLLVLPLLLVGPTSSNHRRAQPPTMPLAAWEFEVSGRVQGVFFRKFAVDKAQSLGLTGWVANTARGTVVGECQGEPDKLAAMQEWLCKEGSPASHIHACEIRQERQLQQLEYDVFERRRNVP